MYVSVVLDIPSKQLDQTFDYKLPSYLRDISVGSRVMVDFNNQKRLAYVVKKSKTSKTATKEVLLSIDKKPILSKAHLKMVDFIKEKAHSTYKHAFDTVIFSPLHTTYKPVYKVLDESKVSDELKPYIHDGFMVIDKIPKSYHRAINQLIYDDVIIEDVRVVKKMNPNYTKKLFIKPFKRTLTQKQQAIINRIDEPILVDQLLEEGYSKNIIDRLIDYGVLSYEKVLKLSDYHQDYKHSIETPTLRDEQINAINQVKDHYQRYLLFGPPGSGKTEVYLKLIERVLKNHKQALILVPEIGLIPQMVSRLHNRFNEEIAVYHSHLTSRQKYDMYLKIINHEVNIIVGVRSAIFSPIDDLGIIILDEAHDLSYIQKTMPYYDAKEMAELLGQTYDCPVLYGSATPSVSMMYETSLGIIKRLDLKENPSDTTVKLIDMRQELIKGNTTLFSNELKAALTNTLNKGEQAIILVNRRGYAPFMMCRTCGFVNKCPSCEVSLVYHKQENVLKCHYCGYEEVNLGLCKVCKSDKIRPVGFGVEQVKESLEQTFKGIRVLRLDQDALTTSSHDAILSAFKNKEADVLLGTQMVSKGHHFSNVSLVSVMLADQLLNLNSYLAHEKAYNLITQHIGRIRKPGGLAIIQAYNIDNFVLKSIQEKSYETYYEKELENRKLGKYLPFYNVIKLTLKGLDEQSTIESLTKIKQRILAKNSHFSILGPIEDYITFKNNRYHYSITLKTPRHIKINSLLQYLDKKYHNRYYIDIDYYPDLI